MSSLTPPQRWMVFDVESVGLHGEGFAVGWAVYDGRGDFLRSGAAACDPSRATGDDEGREWIKLNCPLITTTHETPLSIRTAFWNEWVSQRAQGAVLAADVPWPVEANFLLACLDDAVPVTRGGRNARNPGLRDHEGPYPLVDIASVRLAAGEDPIETVKRDLVELPAHHPVCDAMQSARLLFAALRKLNRLPERK